MAKLPGYNALINAVEVAASWELALQLLEEARRIPLCLSCGYWFPDVSDGVELVICGASPALACLKSFRPQAGQLQLAPDSSFGSCISACEASGEWQVAPWLLVGLSLSCLFSPSREHATVPLPLVASCESIQGTALARADGAARQRVKLSGFKWS